jgi:hypothetical protein
MLGFKRQVANISGPEQDQQYLYINKWMVRNPWRSLWTTTKVGRYSKCSIYNTPARFHNILKEFAYMQGMMIGVLCSNQSSTDMWSVFNPK